MKTVTHDLRRGAVRTWLAGAARLIERVLLGSVMALAAWAVERRLLRAVGRRES
jgi:hypothetical protein